MCSIAVSGEACRKLVTLLIIAHFNRNQFASLQIASHVAMAIYR